MTSEMRNIYSFVWIPIITFLLSILIVGFNVYECTYYLIRNHQVLRDFAPLALIAFCCCFSHIPYMWFQVQGRAFGIQPYEMEFFLCYPAPEFIIRLLFSITLTIIFSSFSWNLTYVLIFLVAVLINIVSFTIICYYSNREDIMEKYEHYGGGIYRDIIQCAKEGDWRGLKEFIDANYDLNVQNE